MKSTCKCGRVSTRTSDSDKLFGGKCSKCYEAEQEESKMNPKLERDWWCSACDYKHGEECDECQTCEPPTQEKPKARIKPPSGFVMA